MIILHASLKYRVLDNGFVLKYILSSHIASACDLVLTSRRVREIVLFPNFSIYRKVVRKV